ncbi:MAG: phosphopantetheine-binding protein, partial [Minicystis sp.]
DEEAILRFLPQIWALDARAVTAEDRRRAAGYAEEQARRGARSHAGSLREFLAGIALEVQIEALEPADRARAAQLTLRTNQLNTTLRRHSEGEIARLVSEGVEAALVRARDRFGDYGAVGLFACVRRADALVVETFLLSCRALGRGIEERMIAEIGRRALEQGIAHVELPFQRGSRNQPARALLERVAGAAIAEHPEGATFSLLAEQAARITHTPIEEPAPARVSVVSSSASQPTDARSALFQRVAEELHDPRAIVGEIEMRRRRGAEVLPGNGAPAGAVEEVVAAIFAAVLGLDRVGAEDGFFALGGQSLTMTELLSRLRDSFLIELPMAAMLIDPTVRGVARATEEIAGAEAAHALADLVKQVNTLSDEEVEALLDGEIPEDSATEVSASPTREITFRVATPLLSSVAARGPRLEAGHTARVAEILARRVNEKSIPRGTIETIAIPTCDRPEVLARCVASHLADARRLGRSPAIVVADDSRSPELASRTREALRAFPSVRYVDHARKRAFAASLAARAGVDPLLVDFALFDPEGAGHATGANFNALLLDGAGELVFRADDDTLGGAVSAPARRSGLALSSGRDPAELWSFTDRASCFEALSGREAVDLLALHASLLGRAPRAIAEDHAENLTLGSIDEAFVRRLDADAARVRVSFTGLAGDCGWGAPFGFWGIPLGYLLLEGDALARLTRDEAHYRTQCTRRDVIRATTRVAIGDATFGMTTFVGLDLQDLVPPYLPVCRGQDVLWVQTLEACFEGALFGHVPCVLRHEPAELRRFALGEIFRSATGLDLARVFVALLRSADLSTTPSGAPRLRALGERLATLGTLAAADFEAVLRDALLREHDRLVSWADRVLAESPRAPSFWRADVARYLDEAGRFLTG